MKVPRQAHYLQLLAPPSTHNKKQVTMKVLRLCFAILAILFALVRAEDAVIDEKDVVVIGDSNSTEILSKTKYALVRG